MVLNIRVKRLIEAILVWCYFLLFVFRAIIIHRNSTNGWLVAFGLVEYSHPPDHMKSILVGLPKWNWSDFLSKYVRLVQLPGFTGTDGNGKKSWNCCDRSASKLQIRQIRTAARNIEELSWEYDKHLMAFIDILNVWLCLINVAPVPSWVETTNHILYTYIIYIYIYI